MRARHRRIAGRITAIAAAGALTLAGAPALVTAAHADLDHANSWATSYPALRVLGETWGNANDGRFATTEAGPTGTVYAVVQNSTVTPSEVLQVATVPHGAGTTPTWATPSPDAQAIGVWGAVADATTGDAVVAYSVLDSGSDADLLAVTYDASTHTWSAPAVLVDGTDDVTEGSVGIAVVGHHVHAVVERITRDAGDYTATVEAYGWDSDTTPGAPQVLDTQGPAAPHVRGQYTETPVGGEVAVGVDAGGTVHAAWSVRDGWSGTEPIDPSTKTWGVRAASLAPADAGTWSAATTLLAPAPASEEPVFFLGDGADLVLLTQRHDVTSPGTAPGFDDATYGWSGSAVRYAEDGTPTTSALDTTKRLTLFGSQHRPFVAVAETDTDDLLVLDHDADAGLTRITSPSQLTGRPSAVAFAADGSLWAYGRCSADNRACVARRTGGLADGTWSDRGEMPTDVSGVNGVVVADPTVASGVVLLAESTFVNDGYGLIRVYDDHAGPVAATPTVAPAVGAPPLHANQAIEQGGAVVFSATAADDVAHGDLEYRAAMDATPASEWQDAPPEVYGERTLATSDKITYDWTATALGTHTFTVQWRDTAGNVTSAQKVVTVELPPDVTPPTFTVSAPGAVTLGTSFALTRTAGVDGRSPTSAVAVQVDWGDGATATGTLDTASYQHTYAATGSYPWSATAQDEAGNVTTVAGTVAVALPPDVTPPSFVVSASAPVVQGRTFTITRTSGSDNRSSNGHVAVHVDWGDGTASDGTLATPSYTHAYTSVGTFAWTMTATDQASNVRTSGPHAISVLLPPPPSPVSVRATAGRSSARLVWSPRSNTTLYSAITGFVVAVTVPASGATPAKTYSYSLPATAKGATIGNLRNGTLYTAAVASMTAAGSSTVSSAVTVRPIDLPAAPTRLSATARSKHRTRLAWTAPSPSLARPVTGYRVYVNGVLTATLSGRAAVSWTHSREKKGRTYSYAVYAVNAVGRSALAAKVTKKRTRT